MRIEAIRSEDTTYLDEILLDGDRIKLLPTSSYNSIDPLHLRLWCHRHARYGIPTIELIEWLKEQIAGRKAIEIGAGNGDLGFHLGIQSTDSYCQVLNQWVRESYAQMRQPITQPKPETTIHEALDAIQQFQPQVVIGSWITQLSLEPIPQSSPLGVDEQELIKHVDAYIHIGNEDSHGQKKILELPHETIQQPWIISRAANPSKNVIYVWGRHV